MVRLHGELRLVLSRCTYLDERLSVVSDARNRSSGLLQSVYRLQPEKLTFINRVLNVVKG